MSDSGQNTPIGALCRIAQGYLARKIRIMGNADARGFTEIFSLKSGLQLCNLCSDAHFIAQDLPKKRAVESSGLEV